MMRMLFAVFVAFASFVGGVVWVAHRAMETLPPQLEHAARESSRPFAALLPREPESLPAAQIAAAPPVVAPTPEPAPELSTQELPPLEELSVSPSREAEFEESELAETEAAPDAEIEADGALAATEPASATDSDAAPRSEERTEAAVLEEAGYENQDAWAALIRRMLDVYANVGPPE